MLITNQDAPSAFLKTPQGEETNTEEGSCNRTSPGLKRTSRKVRANHAEEPKSVYPCCRRTIGKHPVRISQMQSHETLTALLHLEMSKANTDKNKENDPSYCSLP